MQVEWRKAVRERSYKLSHDCRRHQRLDGEQLKKRLYFEVISTDAVMGRLKRERTQMEERLSRYNGARDKIKSQQMLRHMDGGAGGGCGGCEDNEEEDDNNEGDRGGGDQRQRQHHRHRHQSMPFEIVVHAPSETGDEAAAGAAVGAEQPPVFVSRLKGGGGGGGDGGGGSGGSTARRSIASADGQLFELTESEDELLGDFLDRQRLSDEATVAAGGGGGGGGSAGAPRVLVNGLSLEQFMKMCRSRHLMDSAIERAETFVDEWQASEGVVVGVGGAGGGGGGSSSYRRQRRTAGRRVPLEEPKDSAAIAAAAAAAANEASGQRAEQLEKLERDFKSLLQEAKKARYLRGRNPEIVERDRELTTDEVFQASKPL